MMRGRKREILSIILISLLFTNVTLMYGISLLKVRSQSISSVEIIREAFSSQVDTRRQFDLSTEIYDAGTMGNSRAYIDEAHGWLIFEGDNEENANSTLKDEPLAVIKGYDDPDGFSYYATLPYNYTVSVDFYLPSSNYGYFYLLPRYGSVNDKYEVVVDTEHSTLVFNKVVSGVWMNMKTSPLGFTVNSGVWYTITVEVSWEYNSAEGKYMNKIRATVTDGANMYSDEVWDDSIPPFAKNGLAILGFHPSQAFQVYADNLIVASSMEKVGEDPDSWTPEDLNVAKLWVGDDDRLFFLLKVGGAISADPSSDKHWTVQIDADKDSQASETGWDYEYSLVITLDTADHASAYLFDSIGSPIGKAQILGGGVGYDYWIISVPKSLLSEVGDSILIYGHTKLGTTLKDGFPSVTGETNDYFIYYLNEPPVTWRSSITDDEGDASPAYLDILDFRAGLNYDYLFFEVKTNGEIPWSGGSTAGTYWVFIDVDEDPDTGYPFGGVGAEYLVEYHLGYVPKLWEYAGPQPNWNWNFVHRCEYLYNPGDQKKLVILVPRGEVGDLSREFQAVAATGQSGGVKDWTSPVTVTLVHSPSYSSTNVPLDTSGKITEVVGEHVGELGGYDFSGWYTDTVAYDPSTKTVAIAWLRKDADSYGNDYIYLGVMKLDARNSSMAVKYVWKSEDIERLDSITIGGGRILITWTYYEDSTYKNNVRGALYDLGGNYIAGWNIRRTAYYEEYSKSCYVPNYSLGTGKFLVIWYTSDGEKIEGKWVDLSGNLDPTPLTITATGGLSYTRADLMLCIGGDHNALVVYRYEYSGDLGLEARLVSSSGVSNYIVLYDDDTKEEKPGIKGDFLTYGGTGYFLVPFLSGDEVRYAVVDEDGNVVSNDNRLTINGKDPYAISLNDRFMIAYTRNVDDPNGDPRIANINPASWAYHIEDVDNDGTLIARHPLIAYDPVNDRVVYLWTTGPSDMNYEIYYAVIDPTDSPGNNPLVESIEPLVSSEGNQTLDGFAAVTKDEFIAVYRDWSYNGIQELMAHVRLPDQEPTTDVYMLTLPSQGHEYRTLLEGLIDGASSKIYVAVAFIQYDTILQKLVEAHNRGVDVRVIMDDSPGNDYAYNYLQSHGVPVINDASLGDPTHIMHDKFLVIDGRKLLVSTVNLIEEDFLKNNNTAFYAGSEIAAGYYEREFLQMWNGGSGNFGINKDESSDFIASVLHAGRRIILQGLFTPQEYGDKGRIPNVLAGYVGRASKVRFTSYIFTTSGWVTPLYDALLYLHSNGKDVLGIFDELLNLHTRGRRIYDFIPVGMPVYVDVHRYKMHAKLFVIDDSIAALGSWNPTGSATINHDENVLVIIDDDPSGFPARLSSWIDEMAADTSNFARITSTSTYVAPHLLISEVMFKPDTTGSPDGEWVEIYNPTSWDVDLSNYLIGDSETLIGTAPYDDESLYRFPAGSIIQAGRSIVVAYKASIFESTYGYKPDYEIVDSDPDVPDLILYDPANYGSNWNLADDGDEVLLIEVKEGGFLQIISAAWYGSSTYLDEPVDISALVPGQSIQRSPSNADAAYASTVFIIADPTPPYATLTAHLESLDGDHLTCKLHVTSSWGLNKYLADGESLQVSLRDDLTIEAPDCTGYTFDHWEDVDSVDPSNPTVAYIEDISSDRDPKALYATNLYRLTVRVVGEDGESLGCIVHVTAPNTGIDDDCGDGTELYVKYGDTVTLEAKPCTGYSFSRWEGYVSDSSSVITFNMPDHIVEETAIYQVKNYTLRIMVRDQSGKPLDCLVEIEVNSELLGDYGDGSELEIQEGSEVTAWAKSCPWYEFAYWTLDGLVEYETPITFKMSSDHDLLAIYRRRVSRTTIPEVNLIALRWVISGFPASFRYVARGADLKLNEDLLSKLAGPALLGQKRMLIILGGPAVVSYDWRGVGVKFIRERGSYTSLEYLGRAYKASYGEEDYAIIYVNQDNMVIRIAGVTRFGTRAGLMYLLENTEILQGTGPYLIWWNDANGNGEVDTWEVTQIGS